MLEERLVVMRSKLTSSLGLRVVDEMGYLVLKIPGNHGNSTLMANGSDCFLQENKTKQFKVMNVTKFLRTNCTIQ